MSLGVGTLRERDEPLEPRPHFLGHTWIMDAIVSQPYHAATKAAVALGRVRPPAEVRAIAEAVITSPPTQDPVGQLGTCDVVA